MHAVIAIETGNPSEGGSDQIMTVRTPKGAGAAIGLALLFFACTVPTSASAQQLSDDAVKKYMDYAWDMLPDKFTKPDGKLIKIDKAQRASVDLPVEVGRDAILAGRRSAYAQACGFAEEQVANYRSLMVREEDKKKWSDPQMMFINQIHMTTGMLLNGTIKLVETDTGGKEIKVEEETAPKINKPSDQVCNDILAQIKTFVETGPKIPYQPTAAAADGTAKSASSAPTTTGATPAQPKKTP